MQTRLWPFSPLNCILHTHGERAKGGKWEKIGNFIFISLLFLKNNIMWFRINSMKKKEPLLWLKATVAPLHVVLFSQLLYIYNRAHRNWLLDGATCAVGGYTKFLTSSWPWPPGSFHLSWARKWATFLFYFLLLLLLVSLIFLKMCSQESRRTTAAIPPKSFYISVYRSLLVLLYIAHHLNRIYGTRPTFSPSFLPEQQQHTSIIYDRTRKIVRWLEYKNLQVSTEIMKSAPTVLLLRIERAPR